MKKRNDLLAQIQIFEQQKNTNWGHTIWIIMADLSVVQAHAAHLLTGILWCVSHGSSHTPPASFIKQFENWGALRQLKRFQDDIFTVLILLHWWELNTKYSEHFSFQDHFKELRFVNATAAL